MRQVGFQTHEVEAGSLCCHLQGSTCCFVFVRVCVCFVLSLDVKSMLNLLGNHVCIMHY